MSPFGIERVGDDAARDVVPRLISPADCNHQDPGEASAQDGEKLKSRHLRHVEIGDDDVRGFSSELQKSIKALFCGTDVVSCRVQQHCRTLADARLIIYNKNAMFRSQGH